MTASSQFLEARTTNKRQEVLRQAQNLYKNNPDWVVFYRDVLGIGGVVRQAFPTPTDLEQFEQTDEYFNIQEMLAKLRQGAPPTAEDAEPTRVITVRLPKSLHEALKEEAHDRHTSMNKLCISKLLQMIENELVPKDNDPAKKKDRRPSLEGALKIAKEELDADV
jgi:predicted HicB family RNase H-like nuclease